MPWRELMGLLRLLFASQPSVTENFRNHAVESRGTALRAGHHRLDPVMVSARRISEALVFLGSFSPLVDRFSPDLL